MKRELKLTEQPPWLFDLDVVLTSEMSIEELTVWRDALAEAIPDEDNTDLLTTRRYFLSWLKHRVLGLINGASEYVVIDSAFTDAIQLVKEDLPEDTDSIVMTLTSEAIKTIAPHLDDPIHKEIRDKLLELLREAK